MAFRKLETGFKDLFVIEPDVFRDQRGFFKETYNQDHFHSIGIEKFVTKLHGKLSTLSLSLNVQAMFF